MSKQINQHHFLVGGGGENPLLSIIVPVYNVEKYLRECLDSLIHQTLKEIEIIIVNDASPDHSEEIILEYAAKDERIVYIKHEENKCLGGARNTGIKAARGQYIAFVDSDDYVDLDLYRQAVGAFEKYQVDLVFFPTCDFDERKKCQIHTQFKPCKVYQLDAVHYALNWDFVTAWNKVYRRKDLIENQIYFPEHMYWEDNPFWTEYCCAVEPAVIALPKTGAKYYYRRHQESITAHRSINNKSLPKIFFQTYQGISKNHCWEKLRESFFERVSQIVGNSWFVLREDFHMEYAENFYQFIKQLPFDKINLPSEWSIIYELKTNKSKIALMELYAQNVKMMHNPWYCFSQLSLKEKLVKIGKVSIKRFLRIFGLRVFNKR